MKEALTKLLINMADLVKVKSIISLVIIIALVYGFLTGLVGGEVFAGFAGSIITYFFTRKRMNEVIKWVYLDVTGTLKIFIMVTLI